MISVYHIKNLEAFVISEASKKVKVKAYIQGQIYLDEVDCKELLPSILGYKMYNPEFKDYTSEFVFAFNYVKAFYEYESIWFDLDEKLKLLNHFEENLKIVGLL